MVMTCYGGKAAILFFEKKYFSDAKSNYFLCWPGGVFHFTKKTLWIEF
jgi:hypothetical protein